MLEGLLAALPEWRAMAEGAYSANTLYAQKANAAIFETSANRAESRICRRSFSRSIIRGISAGGASDTEPAHIRRRGQINLCDRNTFHRR
jgi:hypothetical protein